jgi:hypothetical protein
MLSNVHDGQGVKKVCACVCTCTNVHQSVCIDTYPTLWNFCKSLSRRAGIHFRMFHNRSYLLCNSLTTLCHCKIHLHCLSRWAIAWRLAQICMKYCTRKKSSELPIFTTFKDPPLNSAFLFYLPFLPSFLSFIDINFLCFWMKWATELKCFSATLVLW